MAWLFFGLTGVVIEQVSGGAYVVFPFPIVIPALALDSWMVVIWRKHIPLRCAAFLYASLFVGAVCYWSMIAWATYVMALPHQLSGTFSEQFTLSRTTRFTLHVHRGFSSKTAEVDVVVTPPAKEFGGVATCSAAEHAILLSVPLGEPQVSSALTVSSVTNMNPREIVLAKGNVQATVPMGSRSTAFDRQPAAGTWTLQAPLAPNESCEDALRSVANWLTFQIAFTCGE
jgi:hypothetical protein